MEKFKNNYTLISIGLLTGLGLAGLFEIVESGGVFIALAIVVILLGAFLGHAIAHHFCFHHHHEGDSPIDYSFILLLVGVNFFHPMTDGFVLAETFGVSFVVGLLVLLQIIIHEFVRQSVLIGFFKKAGISYGKVLSILFTGFLAGIILSVSGTQFLSQYEWVVDLVTLGAYSIVIAEYSYQMSFKESRTSKILFIILGTVIGILLALFS